MSHWQTVGRVAPLELEEARLELHWAVQLPAITIGGAFADPRQDHSHTALSWSGDTLWSAILPGTNGLRAGLRPFDLGLTLGRDGEEAAHLPLAGRSMKAGADWLQRRLDVLGVTGTTVELGVHPALPTHPLGQGRPFSVVLGPALAELARWLGNAAHLLGNLAPEASPILTWPHHFDIARLLPSATLEDGSPRTVGVGLSLGDEHYGEPYFYVAPWPVPDISELPPLPRGEWQTEAFFAAVLTATELLRETGDEQEETARGFFETAISASRRLLAA